MSKRIEGQLNRRQVLAASLGTAGAVMVGTDQLMANPQPAEESCQGKRVT